jgi:hypothetical protein
VCEREREFVCVCVCVCVCACVSVFFVREGGYIHTTRARALPFSHNKHTRTQATMTWAWVPKKRKES